MAHADIKDNELVFMDVDATLEDFEIDAQGGVVAGNLKVRDTAVSCELQVHYQYITCITVWVAQLYKYSVHCM